MYGDFILDLIYILLFWFGILGVPGAVILVIAKLILGNWKIIQNEKSVTSIKQELTTGVVALVFEDFCC